MTHDGVLSYQPQVTAPSGDDFVSAAPGALPPLPTERIVALNASCAHWEDRPTIPRLTYGELLDERTRQAESYATPVGRTISEALFASIVASNGRREGVVPNRWGWEQFHEACQTRFTGEMVYVTDEMARLADYAAASLPDQVTFTRDMLPSPFGFVRLEQPRYSVEKAGRRTGAIAYGWAPMACRVEERDDTGEIIGEHVVAGLYVMMFAHAKDKKDEINLTLVTYEGAGDIFRAQPYHWSHSFPMPFGESGKWPGWTDQKFLIALFRLMQQEVGVSVREQPDRASRRRAARAGLPTDLHVVRLRRPRYVGEPAEGHGMREWTCRWFVRFHWRHLDRPTEHSDGGQWCERHDRTCYLVAINPYLKNADRDDLPIRDPDRTFTVLSR